MSFAQVYINDGTGGNKAAKVNASNQLSVVTVPAIGQASLLGDAYSWNAVSANIDTTDCMILVSNTSTTRLLVIHKAYFEGDIVGQLDFKLCSATGLTLAGTAITPISLNRNNVKTATALSFADETATPATAIIYTHIQTLPYAAVSGIMGSIDWGDSIILGYNDCFGIDTVLEPAAGFEATVIGYFIDA